MVARAPRKRMYRTMQGRMVDIEKLRAANESVQAVGNMNVNARGDVLGAGGKVITKKEQIIKKYYEQPKGMVSDTPSRGKPMPAPNSPSTTNTHTNMGSSNTCASSTAIGSLLRPCCKNTIARGTRNNQSTLNNLFMTLHQLVQP